MHKNRRTTIIVAGGALAVASVAYSLGTQADDGTAVAGGENGERRLMFEHGPPPGFSNLAEKLGVDSSRLREALADFHEQEHGERQDEFASKLADALGISQERVSRALEEAHQRLERRMERRGDQVMPAPAPAGKPGPHVRPFFPLRQLASELGVTRAELRQALNELRPDRGGMRTHFREHQQELARFLAERFDLDVDEVSEALADLPRPSPPPHGGRPGPGGPGAFGPPA